MQWVINVRLLVDVATQRRGAHPSHISDDRRCKCANSAHRFWQQLVKILLSSLLSRIVDPIDINMKRQHALRWRLRNSLSLDQSRLGLDVNDLRLRQNQSNEHAMVIAELDAGDSLFERQLEFSILCKDTVIW